MLITASKKLIPNKTMININLIIKTDSVLIDLKPRI